MKQGRTISQDSGTMLDELASYYASKFVAIEARRVRPGARIHSRHVVQPSRIGQADLECLRVEIASLRSKLDHVSSLLGKEPHNAKC